MNMSKRIAWGATGAVVLTLAIGVLTSRAQEPAESAEAVPWTEQGFRNNPAHFQFAIVSDPQGGRRKGVFEKALSQVNLLQPEFVMCVGDLIDGTTKDLGILNAQYDEMDALLDGLEMRFYRAVGNHDITNPVMLELYKKRYGTPYYHFKYKDVLFLVVSTEDPPGAGNISAEQTATMLKALEENADVRWTFVFMHKPMFAPKKGKAMNAGWAKIETALVDRPHTVIAGHWHNYAKHTKHGRKYIHLATTGGASKLLGKQAGQFDHIVWVTMTDDGPRIANLMLDGIYDENVRVAK
jgi:hypothetical protein